MPKAVLHYYDPANEIPERLMVANGEDLAHVTDAALMIYQQMFADNLGVGRTIGGGKDRVMHAVDQLNEFYITVYDDNGTPTLTIGGEGP